MASPLPEAEVLGRFAQIVARSLRVDPAAVTSDACLDDLGAESLDLLEITIEAEEEFNILIPQKNILQTAEEVFGEGVVVRDGLLTAAGVRFLKRRMPDVDLSHVAPGMPASDLGKVFQRVSTWVRMIQGLVEQSPQACPSCGEAFPKAVAGRLKCRACGTEQDLPSGDDLNRQWVEEYHRADAQSA